MEKNYPTRQHTATINASVEDTAFWIARLQPLHLGHLDAIKQAFAQGIQKVLIGIGSSDKKGTNDNPFSADDRKKMIMDVLLAEWLADKCSVYYVMDTHDNTAWRAQIDNEIEPFSTVVSDNDYLKLLFPDKKFIKPEMNLKMRGTTIRIALLQKNYSILSKFLHPMTVQSLDELNAFEKIKEVFGPEHIKPRNAVDLVLKNQEGKIALIQRGHEPYGWALPGGMLDYGETTIHAALREWCEELGGSCLEAEIEIEGNKAKRGTFEIEIVRKLSYLDNPLRDPRGHTITFPFEVKILGGTPAAADDAKSFERLSFEEIQKIPAEERAFPDHLDVIRESMSS